MSKDKKSFLLYCDLISVVKQLPPEKAGELFVHILEYVNDNDPITEDFIINLAFEPIKLQLKRDLQKYKNICERNSINGSKGGRPKNPKNPMGKLGTQNNPKKPKKADTDIDTDTDKEETKERFIIFWNTYDKKIDSKKAWEKFQNLKDSEITTILNTVSNYVKAHPDKQFRKNPVTYLNNKCWNDEIEIVHTNRVPKNISRC